MFNWLLKLKSLLVGNRSSPCVPAGMRIYAIGDVHGRLDLLEDLQEKMLADAATADDCRLVQIFVGDYVDRGPASKGVVDWLVSLPPAGWERICLKGNHEAILLDFLDDPDVLSMWSRLGGRETLRSYGVDIGLVENERPFADLHMDFIDRLPFEHHSFFSNLPLYVEFGSYAFVHAGVRPGRSMAEQAEQDLVWIRKKFLNSQMDFGKVIVHGHTVTQQPEVLRNRINIDTGAFMTDTLTCLVLEGEEQRFL